MEGNFVLFSSLKENYILAGCGTMSRMSKGFSQPSHSTAHVIEEWFSLP